VRALCAGACVCACAHVSVFVHMINEAEGKVFEMSQDPYWWGQCVRALCAGACVCVRVCVHVRV